MKHANWPKSHLCLVLASIMGLLAATDLRADAKWILTTADFHSRNVNLVSIDPSGLKISDPAGGTTRPSNHLVPWADVLSLARPPSSSDNTSLKPPTTSPAGFIVYLANGDRIDGSPGGLDGQSLTWTSARMGSLRLPLNGVIGFAGADQPPVSADEKSTDDVVRLANGDMVRGIVSAIAGNAVTVQSQNGNVPVPLSSVRSVCLAAIPGASSKPAAPTRAIRVALDDGAAFTASTVSTRGEDLLITLRDAPAVRPVPRAQVMAIEQLNGPVSWLSTRTPSEDIQIPLLSTTRPARMDQTVNGRPIRFGDRTFAHGIGVAPYSRLSFALDPSQGYASFRTQYAIDGSGSYADVAVRIKLDGKVVHQRNDLTAGELSPVIAIPLNHAKLLTLEVDYGPNLGVQGRFNWIEPALVKSLPAAAATQP